MKVILPHNITLRPYQTEIWDKVFVENYRHVICVLPRRHGKDRTAFNILLAEAVRRPGLYYYAYPTRIQAKTAIWEGNMADGTKFVDHIPKELLPTINKSELKIKLFNDSTIMLVGMDYYDSFRGTNPFGIVYSEYSISNPLGWLVMQPAIEESGGLVIFNYTPYGHNHGYDLFMQNEHNPDWFCVKRTVEECLDENGNRYCTEVDIQKLRDSGTSENMIRQEYYCDWDSALEGCIFNMQLTLAQEENRICDFAIDRLSPVYTFWDFGWNDSTAIWFVQKNRTTNDWDAIYYYENNEKVISFYIMQTQLIQQKLGIFYGAHYSPHDGKAHTLASNGQSIVELAAQLNFNFCRPLTKFGRDYQIEKTRFIFDKVRFHKSNCALGINALKSYRKQLNTSTMQYGDPVHDWASHAASAFMTFACSNVSNEGQYKTTLLPEGF